MFRRHRTDKARVSPGPSCGRSRAGTGSRWQVQPPPSGSSCQPGRQPKLQMEIFHRLTAAVVYHAPDQHRFSDSCQRFIGTAAEFQLPVMFPGCQFLDLCIQKRPAAPAAAAGGQFVLLSRSFACTVLSSSERLTGESPDDTVYARSAQRVPSRNGAHLRQQRLHLLAGWGMGAIVQAGRTSGCHSPGTGPLPGYSRQAGPL